MTVIDVHTHMLSLDWLEQLGIHGKPHYEVKATKAGQQTIHMFGSPFMTLFKEMWDYKSRIRNMNKAGVDTAIVSLTCPNVFWGPAASSKTAARMVNECTAAAQEKYGDRIRWFASIPWQHTEFAREELAWAVERGAVGVMVLANIAGKDLTDPLFAPVWGDIDRRALPVLVHPTAPQGVADLHMDEYGLVPPVGFMVDTTVAFSRMIFNGFLDRYPNLKLIAAHGGATLPYLAGRLDMCHERIPACSEHISDKPSEYLQRIWYDSVVYAREALDLCIKVAGDPERVLYGSDYPHNIGDMAGILARVNSLKKADAKRIAGKNAEQLFGL
ncbi:MAG: amidohydrolase family protein [Alphaproteobacteria bacterium]